MNKAVIEKWLITYGITKYTIHPNLVVDVKGDVNLCNMQVEALPFQFGDVTGHFNCSFNPNLSLQHCPTTVGGTFDCSSNELTSLKYCPTTVRGNFYCFNNNLTSLQYCPTTVGRNFDCCANPFKVIPEDYASWIRAIKVSATVYPEIKKQATPQMKAMHKAMWE